VEVNVLFSLHWKCGKGRGGRGSFFYGNVFFMVEWLGRGRGLLGGRGRLKVATHGGTHGFRVH
jgi:hypothetical protein